MTRKRYYVEILFCKKIIISDTSKSIRLKQLMCGLIYLFKSVSTLIKYLCQNLIHLQMLDCNNNNIFNVPLHFLKWLFLSICLRIVISYQVFLSNMNNFQINQFETYVLLLRARVDLEVMSKCKVKKKFHYFLQRSRTRASSLDVL